MELLYLGKTKDVFKLKNGNVLLKFKDTATGKDGVFDPGENQVGLTIEGLGFSNLKVTENLFNILAKKGVFTHHIRTDLKSSSMEVLPVSFFGKGLEVICRLRATGSFIRRYGEYVKNGEVLKEPYVEITLKDDLRGDPLINQDALNILNIMTTDDYSQIKDTTIRITQIIDDMLNEKGFSLWDIKLEFGIYNSQIVLIDEISSGNMRVSKGDIILNPTLLNNLLASLSS